MCILAFSLSSNFVQVTQPWPPNLPVSHFSQPEPFHRFRLKLYNCNEKEFRKNLSKM